MAGKERTVFLVDSQDFRRATLASFLDDWAGRNGVALVALRPETLLKPLENPADCGLIIFSLSGSSVTSADVAHSVRISRAVVPHAATAVLSDLSDAAEVRSALSAGVDGFLPSDMQPELALRALSFILNGGSFFPPAAMREAQAEAPPSVQGEEKLPRGGGNHMLGNSIDPHENGCMPSMTVRQQDVLDLLRNGQPNKVIARALEMTEATVKVHVRHIMRKLGASNRTQAAVFAANLSGADVEAVACEAEKDVEFLVERHIVPSKSIDAQTSLPRAR